MHTTGAALAKNLATNLPSGSQITIAGRSQSAADALKQQYSNIEFEKIDAGLVKDVKRFSSDYTSAVQSSSLPQLDVLVMSQGILTMQGYTPTPPESIDLKMALHFYSRMLLIRSLLPILSPSAIILSVLDGKRSNINDTGIQFDNLDLSKQGTYSTSMAAKHCLAMTDGMLEAFIKREDSPSRRQFFHAYPGIVDTPLLTKNLPWLVRGPVSLLSKCMTVSADQCAENLLQGIVSVKKDQGPGRYNLDDKGTVVPKQPAAEGQDEKVWQHTWDLVDAQ